MCPRARVWPMPFLLVHLMACCFMLRGAGVTWDDLVCGCEWDVTSASK